MPFTILIGGYFIYKTISTLKQFSHHQPISKSEEGDIPLPSVHRWKPRFPAEDDASHNAAHEDDDGTNDIYSWKGGMGATSPSKG